MDIINFLLSSVWFIILLIVKYYGLTFLVGVSRWVVFIVIQLFPALFGLYSIYYLWTKGHDNLGVIALCVALFYQVRWTNVLIVMHPNMATELPLLLAIDKLALAMARLPATLLDVAGDQFNFNWRKAFDDSDAWSRRTDEDDAAETAWRAHQQRERQQQEAEAGAGQKKQQGGREERRDERREERREEKQREQTARPSGDYAAAVRLFDLAEPFTKEQLAAAYRAKVKAMHPDRWEGLPPHIKKQLDDQLKELNAARDLIKKRKGWT